MKPTIIGQAMEPNGHPVVMAGSGDHQQNWLDRWCLANPVKAWVLGATTLLVGVAIAFLVLKWDLDRTYVVHKSTRTHEIVKILDPKGKEVDLSDAEVKKVTYEVIWVK